MIINNVEKIGGLYLTGSDLEFFKRVWETQPDIYINRIKAINFIEQGRILDVGCGMGQWSVSLASLNKEVHAIDISESRISALNEICSLLNIHNIRCSVCNLELLAFEEKYFDAVFCYSVIFYTNAFKSLKEIYRVLKPGGKVYLTADGLGWYIHNILSERNKSKYYDPKHMAIDSIENTINFFANGIYEKGKEVIIPSKVMRQWLTNIGFKEIIIESEGTINLTNNNKSKSFYNLPDYGVENIYEVIATK